jgi:hypothetical protein
MRYGSGIRALTGAHASVGATTLPARALIVIGVLNVVVLLRRNPWRDLPTRRAELDSDVYTLRRTVPAPRGLSWGDRE